MLLEFVCVFLSRIFFSDEIEPAYLSMDKGKCYNLRDIYIENRVRSVDVNRKCIWLMDGIDCEGERVQLTPDGSCHLNLSICDFHDRAESVKLCD